MSQIANKPRVLCIDDEPAVLFGLQHVLRRSFQLTTAPGGSAALEVMAESEPFEVIVSDMRMPAMNGATFLRLAREQAPESVRILLTGQADVDSAVGAVNEGGIFRFLLKPCPPLELIRTLTDASDIYRLRRVERDLLETTLRGAVEALAEILALTNPLAFGRASRSRTRAVRLAEALAVPDRWQIDVAATLSQIGLATLPIETVESLYCGRPLTSKEQAMVADVPAAAKRLLGHIPRLETVTDMILRHAPDPAPNADLDDPTEFGAAILRVVLDYDSLMSRGATSREALVTLRKSVHRYPPAIVSEFTAICDNAHDAREVLAVTLGSLVRGMVLAQDVSSATGALLIAKGYRVTASLLERLRNLRPGYVQEPLHVHFEE